MTKGVAQYKEMLHQTQMEKQSSQAQDNQYMNIAAKPPKSVTYTSEDMKKYLLPSLNKMIEKKPESRPFLVPVDLKLVNYYKIIKKPMDLSQIQKKLMQDEYSDPWEYMEDVHLMLNNARLYNKTISNIYKSTFTVTSIV